MISSLKDHMRDGLFTGMGEGEMSLFAPQRRCDLGGATMVAQLRTLPGQSDDLYVLPGDPAPQPGADGLHPRLFGGEAGSQPLGGIRLPGTVADLFRGEDPVEEAFAVPIQRLLDSGYFRDIDPGAHNHRGQGNRIANTAVIAKILEKVARIQVGRFNKYQKANQRQNQECLGSQRQTAKKPRAN
jgi:hypothetical protein